MANIDKNVTQSVLEEVTKNILQTVADNVFNFVPYSDTEMSEILEITDEQAMELLKIINDNITANNKLWSSNKTNTEIQNAIIESNKYADELIGQIGSISLEYVTELPTSDIKSNVIYILQGTPNTLNVYNTSTSAFVTVGDLDLDLSQYYTKLDIDDLLANKADDDTVVHQDDVVSDMTTSNGTTVLSTSGLKTELDKKANDDEVVKTADIATTIGSTSTNSQVPSAKAVWDTCQGLCSKTVADVPSTTLVSEATEVSLNQNCLYTVINGICYVSLWGFKATATGQHIVNSSMPKTKMTMQGMCSYGQHGDIGACAFVFNDNNVGKLYVEANITNESLYGSFSYPVSES